jgi:FtsH-binding integral membrane protein
MYGPPYAPMPIFDDPNGPRGLQLKHAAREDRMGFIRKVYGILASQIFVTFIVATYIYSRTSEWLAGHVWLVPLSMVVTIVLLVTMMCCGNVAKRFPMNYVLLGIITFFFGITTGFGSASYPSSVVKECVGITAVIFVGMTAYACFARTSFVGCGPYLFGGLLAITVFTVGLSILDVHLPLLNKVVAGCAVVLFTLYIVYDTQLIIGVLDGHREQFAIDDYVFAALSLYLDIINIFLQLLQLCNDD